MYSFDFERPTTLADAEKALGGDSQLIAGGQTLIPTLKQRLAQPEKLISLTGVEELKGVSESGGVLTIGAATTHATVEKEAAKAYPALAALAGQIGDRAVRNRGTIGGSLANNDPSACYPAAVLASNATVVTNKREIAADDYFQGLFTTALDEGEIITAVKFPIPKKAAYMKFNQPASRFSLVGVFAAETSDGLRLAVTGASNDGVFLHEQGASVNADDMISDLHGSGEYRAHLVNVISERAIAAMA